MSKFSYIYHTSPDLNFSWTSVWFASLLSIHTMDILFIPTSPEYLAYAECMELAIQLQEVYKGHYKENLAFLENLKGGDGPCLTLAGRDQVIEDGKWRVCLAHAESPAATQLMLLAGPAVGPILGFHKVCWSQSPGKKGLSPKLMVRPYAYSSRVQDWAQSLCVKAVCIWFYSTAPGM